MDFSINSRFYHFMNKIADMMILSMLWLLTSLPLFTIGTASTALYYCTVRCIRRENGSVFKDYFRAFKANFRQTILISFLAMVLCVGGTFIGTAVYAAARSGEALTGIYCAYLILLGFGIAWLHYLIAYIARFQATLSKIIKNSFLICLVNFPVSVSMMLLLLVVVLLWVLTLPSSAMMLLLLPAAYALVSSFLLERIFQKYLPQEKNEGTAS